MLDPADDKSGRGDVAWALEVAMTVQRPWPQPAESRHPRLQRLLVTGEDFARTDVVAAR
ncbi:hypothetical protein [Sphingomonas sp. UYP23]